MTPFLVMISGARPGGRKEEARCPGQWFLGKARVGNSYKLLEAASVLDQRQKLGLDGLKPGRGALSGGADLYFEVIH